jgi:hypothetical protein
VSQRVRIAAEKLQARVQDGLLRPGDRFLSARAVARRYGISYQTADRLLRTLVKGGLLTRRVGAGSYLAGEALPAMRGVQLVFSDRAKRPGSFGDRLRRELCLRLGRAGIPVEVTFHGQTGEPKPPPATRFPVIWESPAAAALLTQKRRRALLINDRPAPGLGALLVDSIGIDDTLGGAMAAELISKKLQRHAKVTVLAGPADDPRSQRRIDGFVSIIPSATVHHAPSWYRENAPAASQVLRQKPDAIFACNDRLAQAILDAHALRPDQLPILFGFDDAPIAEQLHLSTIAIPWAQLADAVVQLIRRRLSGDESPSCRLILPPRPVLRLT